MFEAQYHPHKAVAKRPPQKTNLAHAAAAARRGDRESILSVDLLAATNCEEDPTMKFAATILGLAAAANAIELTPDNWDAETAGKTVLIKFLAPW
ncbi:hypothetical protein THAOC_17547 [Thalassiosira oceanica]|uniref:Uncharacterized protein n=1 Tax=Thalassiosira oceanica TaxID=159749 RepID=K0S6Z1_THAOC|nr:hypothetical protein THAOC_17547 [Thalassiosira oceanica]|eukprot:EJK61883.1 hypothetical protein THAOC_17547 [Thalassiosira oceanica]